MLCPALPRGTARSDHADRGPRSGDDDMELPRPRSVPGALRSDAVNEL